MTAVTFIQFSITKEMAREDNPTGHLYLVIIGGMCSVYANYLITSVHPVGFDCQGRLM